MSVATPEPSVSMPPAEPRFVPATIGRPGRVQTVLVACPSWCVVDHVENREIAVEDLTHYGPGAFVQVPTMDDDFTARHELYVNIMSDPVSDDPRMRAAHLVVSNASPDDAHLTDAQGEELANELIRMATDIRAALRTCREANQVAA